MYHVALSSLYILTHWPLSACLQLNHFYTDVFIKRIVVCHRESCLGHLELFHQRRQLELPWRGIQSQCCNPRCSSYPASEVLVYYCLYWVASNKSKRPQSKQPQSKTAPFSVKTAPIFGLNGPISKIVGQNFKYRTETDQMGICTTLYCTKPFSIVLKRTNGNQYDPVWCIILNHSVSY